MAFSMRRILAVIILIAFSVTHLLEGPLNAIAAAGEPIKTVTLLDMETPGNPERGQLVIAAATGCMAPHNLTAHKGASKCSKECKACPSFVRIHNQSSVAKFVLEQIVPSRPVAETSLLRPPIV